MKPFTLSEAKEKFVFPLRDICRQNTPDLNRCWHEVERLVAAPCTPKPFAGRWPTRVLIFKTSDDWERIYSFYFGKRTGRFRIRDILNFSPKRVFWLEFDRENYVRVFDFKSRLLRANLPLMQEHYYRDRSTGNGDLSRYGIAPLQGRSDPDGAYYYIPDDRMSLCTAPLQGVPPTASSGVSLADLSAEMLSSGIEPYEPDSSQGEPGQ